MAHQPSLAVLVTFDFWFLASCFGFDFWHHFLVSGHFFLLLSFCEKILSFGRKMGFPPMRGIISACPVSL